LDGVLTAQNGLVFAIISAIPKDHFGGLVLSHTVLHFVFPIKQVFIPPKAKQRGSLEISYRDLFKNA